MNDELRMTNTITVIFLRHSTLVTRHFDHLTRSGSLFKGNTHYASGAGVLVEGMIQFRGINDEEPGFRSKLMDLGILPSYVDTNSLEILIEKEKKELQTFFKEEGMVK